MNHHPFSDRRSARLALAASVAALAMAAVAGPAAVQAQKGNEASTSSVGGVIQGYVYLDANGDGAFGPSESAVAGVPIRLTGPEGVDTAATDVNGLYRFGGLGAGTYSVAIDTAALAVVLGSTEGLDVPGYDALTVSGATLSGVNFALDAPQVSRLAAALAKAVAAVQAALPGGRAGAGAGTTAMTTTAATAAADVTATDGTTTTRAAAASPTTATDTAMATTATTATGGVKGGRQLSDVTAATTTTSGSGVMTTTMAAATEVVTATAAATTSATTSAAANMAGARAVAAASSSGPETMPSGGLADLFGPGALAAIAGLLSVLGGVGAWRRRR